MGERLFIGGSADGQRIDVPDGMTMFRVAIEERYDEGEDCVIKYEIYRRERLASPSQQYIVFVKDSLTIDAALRALVDCYHPQTDFATLPEK